MKKLVALLAATVLVLAGCGGGGGGGAAEDTTATSTETTAVVSGDAEFDRAFIDVMVPHHRMGIQMAQDAKAGLFEPELITIADSIIATQQQEIDQMLQWREDWFGSRELGSEEEALGVLGLTAAEAGMTDHGMDLMAEDDVDSAFAAAMIPHHEGAIRMAELAQEQADHGELKDLAASIIEAQQIEVDIMTPYAAGHTG
jgi:uncharacterized protein (DUF305 family)